MHSICVFTTTDEELDPMHKCYLKSRLEVLILLVYVDAHYEGQHGHEHSLT